MFFRSKEDRDAFMTWFADIAMRPENLARLSNEELFRRAYPFGIGDVNSGQR
jgi:hypothetical protein